jgi:AraC family transcriptional regulator
MYPKIKIFPEKKLIGLRMKMSFAEDKTFQMWKKFMPRTKEIKNPVGVECYSVQIYEKPIDFNNLNPDTLYEKWAAVEVLDIAHIPEGMESFKIEEGVYAVFLHKGGPAAGPKTFKYIFNEWLPNSKYVLDNRPHFEILGEKYKGNNPDSEEEIWIPVRKKKE